MADVFNGECYLCAKPAGRNFHLHHHEYHPTESDYPRSGRSLYIRLKRLSEAEIHPERFRLLCARCHRRVEGLVSELGRTTNLERLSELLRISITK